MRAFPFSVLAVLVAGTAFAQPPRQPEPIPLPLPAPKVPAPTPAPKLIVPKDVPQPKPEEVAMISKLLRDMAVEKMPTPLVKANDGWGKQKEFAVGRVMLRNPNRVPAEIPRTLINDGLWRRFTVNAREPEKTLAIGVTEVVKPAQDTLHATINVAMDIDFRMEQQLWVRGRQLYSGETRGHCKGALQLKVTVVSKTAPRPGSFFPDILLKITTHDAKIFYDKIVIDHTLGLDGADAEKAGDFVIELVKAIKPDLEKDLLEKGNAAVVKAAGTKEVKVELEKLMTAGVLKKK